MPTDPLLEEMRQRIPESGAVPFVEPVDVKELIQEKRFADALSRARQACESAAADPAYAYWIGLVTALGGHHALAEPWLDLALEANAQDARAHEALALVYKALGRGSARLPHYRKALEIAPDNAQLRAKYAEALLQAGEAHEAETQARIGLNTAPDGITPAMALAKALSAQGRASEAIAFLEQRTRARPNKNIIWVLANLYLRAGRFREGFKAYEIRREQRSLGNHVPMPGLPKPEWKGEPFAGRRLLLVPEQGFGDILLATRYAALLAAQGEKICAVVPASLQPLLASQPYFQDVCDSRQIGEMAYDCWCFMMSLPFRLQEDGSGRMSRVPYISVDQPPRRRREGTSSPLRVGLSWQGRPEHEDDLLRSIPPERFAPLAEVAGIELVACQYEPRPSALPSFIRPLLRPIANFADTAAALTQLDLLISVDSAPAHLAGAMGREVWLLNRWFGDWRWGDSGSTTHWYPTMRILRQPRAGDWDSVIAEARLSLEQRVSGRRSARLS